MLEPPKATELTVAVPFVLKVTISMLGAAAQVCVQDKVVDENPLLRVAFEELS